MGEWVDVPLIGPPNENVEDVELDQWSATVVDGIPLIVEGKLHVRKRPGLTSYIDLGTSLPIDGLFWWDQQSAVIAVSNGRVWKITDATGTKTELTGTTLNASQLVSFATDGTRVIMANGGRMVYTTLAGPLVQMADAQAPTAVSHVAYLDGYILANTVGAATINFSSLNDMTNWAALDFFTAEGSPDNVVAIKEGFRELIILGRESVEFWVNDGQTPFSRLQGSVQPFGTEAPYSLAAVGGTWRWLDHERRLVTMQGRQVVPVSNPYESVIQRYVAVSDAVAYTVSVDGHPLYILNFPTARETLAYNWQSQQWHKWGYWDTGQAVYQRFRGQTYCYARAWNQHLVGDYTNGIIYKMDRSTYTDNTNPIRTLVRTGHYSHGRTFTKRSNILRIRCKRGVANADSSSPIVSIRRRVNNEAQWRNERFGSLGQVGQHELLVDYRRNGIYKTCQLEIVHTDPTEFFLIGAEENIEALQR